MSVRTQSSIVCSPASADALILRPAPSRRLAVWLTAVHAIAIAGVLALPCGAIVRGVSVVAILIHGWLRRPASAGTIVVTADGLWALPDLGLTELRVTGATCWSRGWADLRLRGEAGERAILLLEDQLRREDWCRLQARLGRTRAEGGLP